MGRKMAVEECVAFDVNDLIRNGVFLAPFGTPCNCIWTDSSGREIFRVDFWVEANRLRVSYAPRNEASVSISTIELDSVRCHFGGTQRTFKCLGKVNGHVCGRPVRKLYMIGGLWLCRECGDLTYLARRTHDKRKDALLRDPAMLIMAIQSDNPNERRLGLGAFAQAARRLRKHTQQPAFPVEEG